MSDQPPIDEPAEAAEPAEQSVAQAAAELAAETLGRDLLASMVEELRAAPDCWEKMSQVRQDQTISRMRVRVQKLVSETLSILFRGQYPALPALLTGISMNKGLQVKLAIDRNAPSRYELLDMINRQVVIVLADPEEYVQRMEEIRAQEKQRDLFDSAAQAAAANVSIGYHYTGPDDRPFRRDELGMHEEEGAEAQSPRVPEYDPDAPGPDLSLEPDPLWRQAQRSLETIGIHVDDEAAKLWTEDQCTEAAYYAKVVSDGKGRKPPRPKFLPKPSTET